MPRKNTEADFWARVRVAGPDECWIWTGAKSDRGYGKINWNSRSDRAHRVAFRLSKGEPGPAICHSCDNPSCCNPRHLFSADNGENNRDRARKGRSARLRGETHGQAKLTASDVLKMRDIYRSGSASQASLARDFKICQPYVGQIIRGERWQHLPI